MASNQQSQRHAQHYAHQHMQQASRHRENRDRGVDPSIPTSESDTDQPSVYMSDVRKMAPADKAMESLTTYHVTKLVKKPLTMIERSLNVAKPWEKADIVRRDSLSQDEILERLDEASRKNTKDIQARIAKYPEALRVQVDKATKNREKSERDCRFVWELVQTDDELVPLPPNTEASDHENPDVKYKGSSRRHEAKRKEMTNSAVWSDSSSATGKRRSDRVAHLRDVTPRQRLSLFHRTRHQHTSLSQSQTNTRPQCITVHGLRHLCLTTQGPRQYRNQILAQILDSNRRLSLSRLTQIRERTNLRKIINLLQYTVTGQHKLRSMLRLLGPSLLTQSRERNLRKLTSMLLYTMT
ncbi:hypothetical protein HC256_000800 [Beauveria bassiana]|nr:hypothetical protein HC256_000800 [Beauveria bassiana]